MSFRVSMDAVLDHNRNPIQVGHSGKQFKLLCPGHDDQHHSCTMCELPDGKVVFHCKVGCTTEEIIKSLGLQWSDLFPETPWQWKERRPKKVEPGRAKVKPVQAPPPADVAELAEQYAVGAFDALTELAQILGVHPDALVKLGVGYCPNLRQECSSGVSVTERHWTIPERDPTGKIVGIQNRFEDAQKRTRAKHTRGLVFDLAMIGKVRSGLILSPEGMSSSAAGMSMRLVCVGRPSNSTGGEPLAEVCAPACWEGTAEIVILGENDSKGKIVRGEVLWPGKSGALRAARDAANRLGQPVKVAMPPPGFKDIRDWFNAQVKDRDLSINDHEAMVKLGQEFLAIVMVTAITVWPNHLNDASWQANQKEDTSPINTQNQNGQNSATHHCKPGCSCRRPWAVLLRQKTNHLHGMVVFARCWTWGCTGCAKMLKEKWIGHMAEVICTHANHAGRLFIWEGIPRSSWESMRELLRLKKANYFRIVLPNGRLFILSDKQITGSEEVEVGQAVPRMSEAVLSITRTKRPISTSRKWKLPPDQAEVSKEWERVCNLKGTDPARIVRVLREYGAKFYECAPSREGKTWWKVVWTVPKEWDDQKQMMFHIAILADYVDFDAINREGQSPDRPDSPPPWRDSA